VRVGKIVFFVAYNTLLVVVLLIGFELLYRRIVLSKQCVIKCNFLEYNALLGWVPKAGTYSDEYGNKFTITPERFRKTQTEGGDLKSSKIMICGDSYVFCDSVGDNETWPYYLSQIIASEVINTGVSGYGLDQAILRM